MWPSDLKGRPMFLDNCQDTATFLPDIYPGTPEIEYLPMCNGQWGDCTSSDACCDVHRGINWTQATSLKSFAMLAKFEMITKIEFFFVKIKIFGKNRNFYKNLNFGYSAHVLLDTPLIDNMLKKCYISN